jgi:hypothetical protein
MGWVVSATPHSLFTPGKVLRLPIGKEAGWDQLIWTQRLEEKFFASAGDRTLVVQSAVRHYTDWDTPGDVSTLSSSLQCSVVAFYLLTKENKWLQERCKVNLATSVSSTLCHLIRLEPIVRRIEPTHPTVPTLMRSVRLIGFHPSFTRQETYTGTRLSCLQILHPVTVMLYPCQQSVENFPNSVTIWEMTLSMPVSL